MAEDKHAKCNCHHHGGGHVLFYLGILAIVYGIINYLIISLNMPSYGAWIIGGIFLVLVAWTKKKKTML